MSSDTAKPFSNRPSTNNNSGRLYPEDQAVVDEYLQNGINEVERPPFKPLRLMFWLTVIILLLGGLSQFIGYLIIPS